MSFYRFSDEEVENIKNRLDTISAQLKQNQRTAPDEVWYDSQEFLRIMNVSKRTAAYWRTEKIISYVQVGHKIYYRLSDILDLLDRCKVPAAKTISKTLTDGNNRNS